MLWKEISRLIQLVWETFRNFILKKLMVGVGTEKKRNQ